MVGQSMEAVAKWFQKYAVMLRIEFAAQAAYRSATIIWIGTSMLLPLVNLAVWTSIARLGPVRGFTPPDFAAYYLVMIVIEHVSYQWVGLHMDHYICEGGLSHKLLVPVDLIHREAVEHLAHKLIGLTFLVPLWIILARAFNARPYDYSVTVVIEFMVSLVFAGILSFLLGYAVAMIGFWTTRTRGLYDVFTYGVTYLLAGKLFPLELLPGGIQTVLPFLPFPYIAAFPASVILGRLTFVHVVQGVTVQAGWIVIAVALWKVLWGAGIRRYTAVGL